jgi:hypothetical protein
MPLQIQLSREKVVNRSRFEEADYKQRASWDVDPNLRRKSQLLFHQKPTSKHGPHASLLIRSPHFRLLRHSLHPDPPCRNSRKISCSLWPWADSMSPWRGRTPPCLIPAFPDVRVQLPGDGASWKAGAVTGLVVRQMRRLQLGRGADGVELSGIKGLPGLC